MMFSDYRWYYGPTILFGGEYRLTREVGIFSDNTNYEVDPHIGFRLTNEPGYLFGLSCV